MGRQIMFDIAANPACKNTIIVNVPEWVKFIKADGNRMYFSTDSSLKLHHVFRYADAVSKKFDVLYEVSDVTLDDVFIEATKTQRDPIPIPSRPNACMRCLNTFRCCRCCCRK